MIDEKLARFESHIEQLVENAFASFFGKRIHAQDIALELARSMQSELIYQPEVGTRPLAPDYYVIKLNPHLHYQINARQPNLPQILGQHIVQLAMNADYRLVNIPLILFENDLELERNQFIVKAFHSDKQMTATAGMQRVTLPTVMEDRKQITAQLLINTERAVRLNGSVINIGRQHDNDIVIEDSYVSRHHLQIRRRFNEYILFDVNSRCGTKVNNTEVKEHRLQPGDVISIGTTTLVYMEDADDDHDLPKTQPLE